MLLQCSAGASVSASAPYSGTYNVVLEVLSDTGQVEEHVDAGCREDV